MNVCSFLNWTNVDFISYLSHGASSFHGCSCRWLSHLTVLQIFSSQIQNTTYECLSWTKTHSTNIREEQSTFLSCALCSASVYSTSSALFVACFSIPSPRTPAVPPSRCVLHLSYKRGGQGRGRPIQRTSHFCVAFLNTLLNTQTPPSLQHAAATAGPKSKAGVWGK